MKPPRPKPHIVVSDEPLRSGHDQQALCKQTVHRAAFLNEWLGTEWIPVLDLRGFCGKCIELCPHPGSHRYTYGILDGELLRHQDL